MKGEKMENQPIYEVATRKTPELNMDVIKKFICPKATDQEAFMFLQLCRAQSLNPFLKEAYLIKYGTENATMIVGKDTFTKRADRLPQYDGFKAGIIVLSQAKITHREGSFLVEGETLLGGWAEVFRKDRTQSFRNEVSLKEYERRKADGSLMSNWKSMPATMIRKVALVQSLREAFPDEFGGMYSPEEMPVDAAALPSYNYSDAPSYPAPASKPPVAPPQKKAPAKAAAPQTVTVKISEITHKDGTKEDGNAYRVFAIVDEKGERYSTFSETFADMASTAINTGDPAKLTFTVGQYGNKLTDMVVEDVVA
jgi:phage recombination protein Bet